jgi:hypothetical protein
MGAANETAIVKIGGSLSGRVVLQMTLAAINPNGAAAGKPTKR